MLMTILTLLQDATFLIRTVLPRDQSSPSGGNSPLATKDLYAVSIIVIRFAQWMRLSKRHEGHKDRRSALFSH